MPAPVSKALVDWGARAVRAVLPPRVSSEDAGRGLLAAHTLAVLSIPLVFAVCGSRAVRLGLVAFMTLVLATQIAFGGCIISRIEERLMGAPTQRAALLSALRLPQSDSNARCAVFAESLVLLTGMISVLMLTRSCQPAYEPAKNSAHNPSNQPTSVHL